MARLSTGAAVILFAASCLLSTSLVLQAQWLTRIYSRQGFVHSSGCSDGGEDALSIADLGRKGSFGSPRCAMMFFWGTIPPNLVHRCLPPRELVGRTAGRVEQPGAAGAAGRLLVELPFGNVTLPHKQQQQEVSALAPPAPLATNGSVAAARPTVSEYLSAPLKGRCPRINRGVGEGGDLLSTVPGATSAEDCCLLCSNW